MGLRRRSALKTPEDAAPESPASTTWDESMYELYVRRKIAEGVKAVDEGRVVSHDEVRRQFSPNESAGSPSPRD